LSGRALRGCSSEAIIVSPPRPDIVTGDFPLEPSFRLCLQRALERADGIGILLVAGELVFLRAILGKGPHQPALVIGILKPVEEHVVLDLAMAEPRTATHLGQQIGRIGHAFHAARHHHRAVSGEQLVMGNHGGFHPRSAHLVERRGRHVLRQARREGRLARRRLALSGTKHIAHDDLVHLIGRNTGTLQCSLDGNAAEFGRTHGGEFALKPAHRRSGGTCDDDRIGNGHG